MSEIELSTLKTGEPAYLIGAVAYALISRDNRQFMWTKLAYGGADLSIMEAGMFSGSASEKVASVDEFVARLEEKQLHHEQAKAFGRFEENCKTNTPWGQADGVERFVKGINYYSTPSHGGFKVAATLNAKIPVELRNDNGWYEKHCEWAKVAFALPQFFTDYEKKDALRTLIEWFPDEYEALSGETIPEGKSHKKDERLFHERNADNWVVISAITSDVFPGMVETYATKGGLRQKWNTPPVEEKRFLVPSEEYSNRSPHGFVLNLEKHMEFSPEAGLKM